MADLGRVPEYGLERMAVFEEVVYMYAKVKAEAGVVTEDGTPPDETEHDQVSRRGTRSRTWKGHP